MQSFEDWTSAMLGRAPYLSGHSPLERLPNELLFKILELLLERCPTATSRPGRLMSQDLPSPIDVGSPVASLSSCLQVTRRLHNIALPLFYNNVKFTQKRPSKKLYSLHLLSICLNLSLAYHVRTIDLSGVQESELSSHLPRALQLLPRLRALHLQLAQIKQLYDEDIRKIFFEMHDLETLSLKNSDWEMYPSCISDVLRALESVDSAVSSNLRSLAFRQCRAPFPEDQIQLIDKDIFGDFLQRFPNLYSLDLARTPVDAKALQAINQDARLQFLRITTCQDSSTLAQFISTHPSVRSSLVVFDGTGVRFTEQETTTIIEHLPPTLRSLNLSSSTMVSNHVPDLQKLCRHLEELSVGRGLTLDDVETMILRPNFTFSRADPRPSSDMARILKDKPGYGLALGPMRYGIALCKLRRRLASVSGPRSSSASGARVQFLDISGLDKEEQGWITNSVLLGEHSRPLKTIVASNISTENSDVLQKLCGGCEWRQRWCNGMSWIERD